MTDIRKKEINALADKLVRLHIELRYLIHDEDDAPDRSDKAMDRLDEASDLFDDLIDALDRATD